MKISPKPPILEVGKSYDLTCEVIGSHPRAKIVWLEVADANATPLLNDRSQEGGNSTVVLSTLKFSPTPEDNEKNLKCRGENTELPNASREDYYHLNVVCES